AAFRPCKKKPLFGIRHYCVCNSTGRTQREWASRNCSECPGGVIDGQRLHNRGRIAKGQIQIVPHHGHRVDRASRKRGRRNAGLRGKCARCAQGASLHTGAQVKRECRRRSVVAAHTGSADVSARIHSAACAASRAGEVLCRGARGAAAPGQSQRSQTDHGEKQSPGFQCHSLLREATLFAKLAANPRSLTSACRWTCANFGCYFSATQGYERKGVRGLP